MRASLPSRHGQAAAELSGCQCGHRARQRPARTHQAPGAGYRARRGHGGVGGFGALFRLAGLGYRDPILVSSTDGVGTKQKRSAALDGHDTIGIDLVAMCVNDVVVGPVGRAALYSSTTSRPDESTSRSQRASSPTSGRAANRPGRLVGGETAEMPDLYAAGTTTSPASASGWWRPARSSTRAVRAGDALIGIAASGPQRTVIP